MNASCLYDQLKKSGVVFQTNGIGLKILAPRGYMDKAKLALAKKHKLELIAIIKQKGRALVWKARINGKVITIIDPDHETYESMLQTLKERFNPSDIAELTLKKES